MDQDKHPEEANLMRRWRRYLVVILFLSGLVAAPQARGQFLFFRNPMTGQKASDFQLRTTDGNVASFNEMREDRPAIIFFWATWCPHCREQLRVLDSQRLFLEEKDIRIILVDLGEDGRKVRSYLTRGNLSHEVLLDEDSQVSSDYKVMGVPTYFFVDREGIIQAVEHVLPENYAEFLCGADKKTC